MRLPRQAGKTTHLINQVLADEERIMIVCTMMQKKHITKQHPEMKGKVFSIGEINPNTFRGTKIKKAYIDELNYVLFILTGLYPEEVTYT